MSHVTEIEMEVKNLNALSKACDEIGVKLMQNQKTFRWFGSRKQSCDHAITIPGNSNCYEIGVSKIENSKSYKLAWDQFAGAGGMVEKVGPDAEKLKNFYLAEVSKQQLKRQGFRIQQTIGVDGQITLIAV